MKKTLLALLTLSSLSSFAASDCTYFAKEVGSEIGNSLSRKAIKVVEHKMRRSGFKRVYDLRDAEYTLEFSADWYTGAYNGMENVVCGDASASAKLISNLDQKVMASSSRYGVAGVVCSVAKNLKAASLLEKSMKAMPNCSEL